MLPPEVFLMKDCFKFCWSKVFCLWTWCDFVCVFVCLICREHKYSVRLSHASVTHLLQHLKVCSESYAHCAAFECRVYACVWLILIAWRCLHCVMFGVYSVHVSVIHLFNHLEVCKMQNWWTCVYCSELAVSLDMGVWLEHIVDFTSHFHCQGSGK